MSLRCRIGVHKWGGEGERIRDDTLATASGGFAVIAAYYFRYHCTRCGRPSDTGRTSVDADSVTNHG